MDDRQAETSSTGLDVAVAAMLAYALGWLSGALFLAIEKKSRFVRFHAWQSVLTFLPIVIALWFLPVWFLLWPAIVVLWLLLMFKAFKGERFKLPVVGSVAERRA
ncbi:MAG TPA: hypothetical protein VK886_13355 [Vicinamibacterales bacterium]|nr:hypothetical protein [Vicinamibacterales bacterium]